MKNKILLIFSFIIIVIIFTLAMLFKNKIFIEEVNISYDEEKYMSNIAVKVFSFSKDNYCIIKNKDEKITEKDKWFKVEKGLCKYEAENGEYKIYIKNGKEQINKDIKVYNEDVKKLEVSEKELILPLNAKHKIKYDIDYIGKVKLDITSNNEKVAVIEKETIKTVGVGSAIITLKAKDKEEKINVTVTNLITLPILNTNKPSLPCNKYTKEDAKLLDSILEKRVKDAGYKTRAGVVAALRFLTLEFPYRINYFYENGRLNNNTGGAYVDGEGRFYHKGLYLSEDKFNEIVKSLSGPSIWGCPLTNWENDGGYKRGVRYPNGLDCSGFISWAFYNGGFDVKDTGAGENPFTDDDLSDLGTRLPITRDLVNSNVIKAGDVIAKDGHIALCVGIDDNNIYIAESTVNGGGVNISSWTKETILHTKQFTYVILLDDFYKNNGNYTNMW